MFTNIYNLNSSPFRVPITMMKLQYVISFTYFFTVQTIRISI